MDQRHSISPVNTTAVPEPAINRPGADYTGPTTTQQNHADQDNEAQRPGTPPRPPYSPVTPVFAHLAPVKNPSTNGTTQAIVPPTTSPSPTSQVPPTPPNPSSLPPRAPPTFAPEPPPPVPISESDNPDAIALRSAISILQLQKQQSLRDIQTLERMKEAAAKDPERFARELVDGKLARKEQGGFIDFNHEEEDRDGDTETPEGGSPISSELGTLPAAQNIVRMPAINWANFVVLLLVSRDGMRRRCRHQPRQRQRRCICWRHRINRW
ncbi:uncharacterized protein BDW70DRAFT_152430 [Aspergillus foveolatus]|uniref:uncharacterized protein n=1 Tax=Aspergillus foveolatus TaxID=210207 RepID=UPI003CCC9E72